MKYFGCSSIESTLIKISHRFQVSEKRLQSSKFILGSPITDEIEIYFEIIGGETFAITIFIRSYRSLT